MDKPITIDPELAEFALGTVVGLTVLLALARTPALLQAVLILIAGWFGWALFEGGVPGLIEQANTLMGHVWEHLAFFKGLALGKLLAGFLHFKSPLKETHKPSGKPARHRH